MKFERGEVALLPVEVLSVGAIPGSVWVKRPSATRGGDGLLMLVQEASLLRAGAPGPASSAPLAEFEGKQALQSAADRRLM